MSIWQPRSVQQLILVGFFVALAPLCVAILVSTTTLGELADKNMEVTQRVVEVTRLGQDIQSEVLNLERRARQHLALGEPELAQLFERERIGLLNKLQLLRSSLPSPSTDIIDLIDSLTHHPLTTHAASSQAFEFSIQSLSRAQLDHDFSLIRDQGAAVNKWLVASTDQLLKKNATEAGSYIDTLVWQLAVLAFATLALLLSFAYWINKPIRDLTQEIHLLGSSGLSHSIEISGPLELQALGSELEWLRQGLHEAEQQKQQFLRHISHELKTPLSRLREGADLLSEQVTGHLSQQQHQIVDIVRHNGIELQRLIENLLDYNQLPHQELTFEEIDLQAIWQELLTSYRISIENKSLHLALHGELETWVADRYKLKTTLDNLLSNAVNYTPMHGHIDIGWHTEDANLHIYVANSGEAIPTKDVERVFEPFFQSASTRTGPIKGSGIGLSVARECIEAQGGSLSLTSHKTLPVCFCVTCTAH
jgi:two-component system sensor histidine kinase GlrK